MHLRTVVQEVIILSRLAFDILTALIMYTFGLHCAGGLNHSSIRLNTSLLCSCDDRMIRDYMLLRVGKMHFAVLQETVSPYNHIHSICA